jgi:cation diffusion facilitator CzcD-associated flavoprotein CzcO
MMHSSKWNSDVDLENKVVAVVGSGASAVQIISEVVPKVKKLICFQRYIFQTAL